MDGVYERGLTPNQLPRFSGLASFKAIMLIKKAATRFNVPKTAHLLGQEWDKILAGQNCLSHAVLIRSKRIPGQKS